MPADPDEKPGDKPAPEPPPREITLEEWIEATQSCCGMDHDDE